MPATPPAGCGTAAGVPGGNAPGAVKAYGQLVPLGFGVTASTPAAYPRRGLRRPYETSSCGRLRA